MKDLIIENKAYIKREVTKSTFNKETLSAEYMTIEELRRLLHEDLKNVEQILKKNAENSSQ